MKVSIHLICRARLSLALTVLAVMALPAFAGEYAVLNTGFRLHADTHEVVGTVVRLHDGEGVTEIAAASITAFEPDGRPAAMAAPAAVAAQPPAPAPASSAPQTPQALASQAARKYALPESFVQSVMQVESNFQPGAVSPRGAAGLMQLMPDTAKHLGVDPKDPAQNANGGAQYLRELLAKYENDPDQVVLALAAYNAGPGAVEKYRGVPPYRETREYIVRVLKDWQQSGKNDWRQSGDKDPPPSGNK